MKTLKLELPYQLAKKIESLVEAGWFASEEELTRLALSEFLRHHNFQLQEQFQRDDIQWALSLKECLESVSEARRAGSVEPGA